MFENYEEGIVKSYKNVNLQPSAAADLIIIIRDFKKVQFTN